MIKIRKGTEGLKVGSVVLSVFIGIIGIFALFGTWFSVDEGERAVILRNGAIIGTAGPGLHFKLPIVDGVEKISVQTKVVKHDQVAAYSHDQQAATFDISVNYRLLPDQVSLIYSSYGGEKGVVTRLIDRRVFEQSKTVFGRFNAASAIRDRGRLNVEIEDAIRKAVAGPVFIESVQIENVDFSDAYEASIEKRMLAEVEVDRTKQDLEREKVQAEIEVTKANAIADSNLAKAKAEAESIRLRGEAEATAIKAKGTALRDNPNLPVLIHAERWNGILPTTMVPNGTVPFLDMKAGTQ